MLRGHTLRANLTILLSTLVTFGGAGTLAAAKFDAVLGEFVRDTPAAFEQALERRKPAPLPPDYTARVLAQLPTDGEVTRLGPDDLKKLEAVRLVLDWNRPEKSYRVKVVESPQARVGNHARLVVLISAAALRVLPARQLQALAAHEVAHEYVWEQYEEARRKNDSRRVRELELTCDGIGMFLLFRMGADPAALLEALRAVDAYDRWKGLRIEDGEYPSLNERANFGREIGKWLASSGTAQTSR